VTPTSDEVKQLFETLLDAWNRRDAAGMAALYGASGSQVGFDGSTANGAEEIRAHLFPIFTDHPIGRFVAKVREVREMSPNTALLRAIAVLIPRGHDDINIDTLSIQSLVTSRDQTGRWRIELFQNTPAALHGRPGEREKLAAELRAVHFRRD
jgi:uncharacterized protein (TIGR02246 family)